jgi:hypothetical protein
MIKPVYINEKDVESFDEQLGEKLNFLNMSYSELVREVILNGDVLDSEELPNFYAKESRKSPAKFVILAIR